MKLIKLFICGNILFFLAVIFNACFSDDSKVSNGGIVLSFDDYYPAAWEQHFDLFDKYKVKVTFFVQNGSVTDFMLNAQSRGHEIGYHTISHPNLRNLSIEEFFEETISRISIFKDAGIELTSFAYPYGYYHPWMHDELLEYYKIVRGFNIFELKHYTTDEMKFGFIDSISIDNIMYRLAAYNRDDFYTSIDAMLKSAKENESIIVLTSHSISDNDWGITPERLEYILRKGRDYGLRFYRFKDFQY